MCTIVVLNEYVEGYPLVVAANRDERYDRRSRPPEVDRGFIRPWDDERDGTWLGVSSTGWFVGITNQDDGHHDATALSRGKVVEACLQAENHCAAAKVLKGLELGRYNPFNVVFGRPGAMFLTRAWEGHELEMLPLVDGINVVSNDCWGSAYRPKTTVASTAVGRIMPGDPITEVRSALVKALSCHCSGDDPFQSLCVHADEHAFGTRSTSIITVSNEGIVEYWYSEGHPCMSAGLTLAGVLDKTR